MSPYNKYQVALSFAGEQREYAKEVARFLASRSINVFYDEFEKVPLWGKSMAEVFESIFAQQSGFVVMFISSEYVNKPWPRHERRVALSCAIQQHQEYILPVRFDDTPVPGLPDDVNYIDAGKHTPAELATLIAEKIGISRYQGKASNVPPPRTSSLTGEVVFDYSNHNGCYTIGSGKLEFETKWSKASNTCIHVDNDPASINGVALASGFKTISEITTAASLNYTSRSRTPEINEIVVLRNETGFYAALHILEIKDDSRGDKRDELRFRYAIQADGSDNFSQFKEMEGM